MMQLDMFTPQAPLSLCPLIFDFDTETRYQPPPPPPPVEPAYRIKFSPGTKSDEIVKGWQALPREVQRGRLILTFSAPVRLQYNRRKSEVRPVHTFRLFMDDKSGSLCNSLTGRSGFYISEHALNSLVSIEPEPKKDLLSMVKKLANRIHPNAWSDLKTKLLDDPDRYLKNYGYTVTSITGKFPGYVLDNIRQAFEGKSNYSYDAGGCNWGNKKTGRDLKVECKLGEDGIFRAWFYSEFPGCANGDCWLLLNPTTAAFKERS